MTELRAEYDANRKEIESRLVAAETQAADMSQRRKAHPFANYDEAVAELHENEALLADLNACGHSLATLKDVASRIESLVQSHESAPMKQEIIGLEYRFDHLRNQISRLVSARSVVLERIQVITTQVTMIERKVHAAVHRPEGVTDIELDAMSMEVSAQRAQIASLLEQRETSVDPAVRALVAQEDQRLLALKDELDRQRESLAGARKERDAVRAELARINHWAESALEACKMQPHDQREAQALLNRIDAYILQLPEEYEALMRLKAVCPSEQLGEIKETEAAFNDLRTKLPHTQRELSDLVDLWTIIDETDLAEIRQWIDAAHQKLDKLKQAPESDLGMAVKVMEVGVVFHFARVS